MRGVLLYSSILFAIHCAGSSDPQKFDGSGGHHATTGAGHHGNGGCHMERTDARSVTFATSGSTATCTSTHSQCVDQVLDFATGCDSSGCFMGVVRSASGESYRVTFDQLEVQNETHALRDFTWTPMTCENRAVSGVSGVFCSTTGAKTVAGLPCQIGWSTVLPESGMMTTARYSCRPDTMKVDMSFSSCMTPSLALRARFTGPAVASSTNFIQEESFNGVTEHGMLLQDEHTYVSWMPYANSLQMPVSWQYQTVSQADSTVRFHIDSKNSTLVVWDPKLAASSSMRTFYRISTLIIPLLLFTLLVE